MNDRKFEVRCNANAHGQLHVFTDSLSIRAGQAVRRNGTEEIWDSVLVFCQVGEDGVLTTKVVVCHPDWDQQLQIASIQSMRSADGQSAPALEINLSPVRI
jgi:hypothetical protein